MTLIQLNREVPSSHRYAIVQVKDLYWVIDMYRLQFIPSDYKLSIGKHEVFKDLDAAICAAVLNYHRD